MSRAHRDTTSHLAAVSVDVLEKRDSDCGPETKKLRSGLAARYGLAGEQSDLLREETSLRNFKLELDSQTSLQVGHCWIKCSATKIRDLRPGSLPHCQARACFQLLSCPQAGHLHRTLARTGLGDMIRVRVSRLQVRVTGGN